MCRSIRNCLVLIVLQIFLLGIVNAWAGSHRYDTGIMTAISDKVIVMSGKSYRILPQTTVVIKTKNTQGAYYEHRGSLSNLRIGEKMFLKVTGYNILEVEVLR